MSVDLKAERLNRGLTLDALSAETDVPKSTLARMEGGVSPRPAVRLKIASYYGYEVTEIWPVEQKAAA